jgi:hypothetical protein
MVAGSNAIFTKSVLSHGTEVQGEVIALLSQECLVFFNSKGSGSRKRQPVMAKGQ